MNTDIREMDIWTAYLPLIKHSDLKCGTRPVVVVSNDLANRENTFVTVIPLTKNCATQQKLTHALLTNRYLDCPSRALCEQIVTLDKRMFQRRIGHVEDAFEQLSIRHAIHELITNDNAF